MIFLDANCFLRWFIEPPTEADRRRAELVGSLFQQLQVGTVEATTTESIISEVAYILTAKRHYQLPVATAASYLATILQAPGLKLPAVQRRQWLTALAVWAAHPALGFVDALTSAIVSDRGHELASFDQDFARFPDIRSYWPAES